LRAKPTPPIGPIPGAVAEAPHASMPIRVGASLAKNFSTSLRRSWRRNTGVSFSSTP